MCICVVHVVKKILVVLGLLFIIDCYDSARFALGCSLSYCFRVYVLRQTRFKSSVWLFPNYLFFFWFVYCLRGFTCHAIGGISKQHLYLTRAVSKDQMSLGQVFHFCPKSLPPQNQIKHLTAKLECNTQILSLL